MSSITLELNNAGFSQRQLLALLQLFADQKANMIALTTKLDADAGVTDTNFTATQAALPTAIKD